jgi:DNA-directed RNA polymerase subunit RPC12/RpoP
MIEFDCPGCGEPMEFKNSMAGRKIECPRCNQRLEVPDEDTTRFDAPPKTLAQVSAPASSPQVAEDQLSGAEFLGYFLVCLLIPAVNVILTSVLYYSWRSTRPKRAQAIKSMGFMIFGIHCLLGCIIRVMLASAQP